MYKDPILTIIAELRIMIDSKDEEIAQLNKSLVHERLKTVALEGRVMSLSENLMKGTVNV